MWHILAVLAFALAFAAGLFFFAFLWPWQPWHRPPQ
jgi:hypothetical protein